MYIYIWSTSTCVHKHPLPSLPFSNAEIANAFSFDCILFHGGFTLRIDQQRAMRNIHEET